MKISQDYYYFEAIPTKRWWSNIKEDKFPNIIKLLNLELIVATILKEDFILRALHLTVEVEFTDYFFWGGISQSAGKQKNNLWSAPAFKNFDFHAAGVGWVQIATLHNVWELGWEGTQLKTNQSADAKKPCEGSWQTVGIDESFKLCLWALMPLLA